MAGFDSASGDQVSRDNFINSFAARLIRRKARELSLRPGFSATDRDEIEQQLRMVLLKRLDKFDPAVAHYNAFVTTVVERYTATILEHGRAESRSHRRYGGSLNQMVDDGDGNQIEMGATIHEGQHCVRTGARFRSLGRVCEAVDRRRIAQCVGLLKKGCAPWTVVATAEHTKMDDGRLVLVCSRSGGDCQEPCRRAAIHWRHEVPSSTTGSHTLRLRVHERDGMRWRWSTSLGVGVHQPSGSSRSD